jgi:hypothetical protein
MAALPTWASNPEGRALLQQIVANPPTTRVVHDDWGRREVFNAWPCRAVGKLRRMHLDWVDRQIKALDTQFAVSGHWDEAASRAIFDEEDADQLIARVLREAGQERAAA